ncbi:T9SS type A sorting domain-containing protein [Hymenobacter sp. BT730]|uniref:T9SS type A sorting domain-containing protein n=1 Tax=Hymenobacter sp. BT730 TaxID=3063332 RepID=UPI0026E0DAB4|nr:T9SS type A sorting domain-containing protein [Hymenobacter sp. BT730]
MKTNILSFVLFSLLSFGLHTGTAAQTVYTTTATGGTWSDPDTWTVTGTANANRVPTNQVVNGRDVSNNIIIINAPVQLDRDYTVSGNNGIILIGTAGSIEEAASTPGRALNFGQQTGADQQRLLANGSVEVTSMSFLKADALINAPLTAKCSISISNQSTLTVASNVSIEGDLIVRQGNPSIEGTGALEIDGCVRTQSRGNLNGLFGPNLRVCIQGQDNACSAAPEPGLDCNPNALQAIAINGCAPLPVELINFSAKYVDEQVQLNWATAMERASSNFTVERSQDGRQFEAVSVVPAAGQSSSTLTYSSVDKTPRAGTSYYRLKATDTDGTFSYSSVAVVQVGKGNQTMTVYGNLSSLNLDLRSPGTCRAIRVLDSMGRVVYTEQLAAETAGTFSRTIPLRTSVAGIYIVQAMTSTGMMSQKILLN